MKSLKDLKGSNDINTDIGDKFQQETKYDPEKLRAYSLDWSRRPEPYKNYESPLAIIPLPEPDMKTESNLWSSSKAGDQEETTMPNEPLKESFFPPFFGQRRV